jgi:hypothetical protein
MVSSKDVSPQQCFLQVMQNKIELPNLLFDMCKTCERRRNLYYIFWVFCYILLREHLHFSYCKFVFKLYTAIAVLVGLDGDLARATCEVRSGTNRLAIHCNFRGCVKGRLHSRFLRPFLRPRWRRRPTGSFALSRTRSREKSKGSCWAMAPSRTEKRTQKTPV